MARQGLRAVALPMSGYGRASPAAVYESRNTPAQHYSSLQPDYSAYTTSQPQYSSSSSQQQTRHRPGSSEQQSQLSTQPLNDPYGRQYSEPLQVIGSDPRSGTEGTQFTVHLHSTADLTTDPRSFRFTFGTHKMGSTSRPKHSTRPDEYQLSIEVPAFRSTGWRSPQVKVLLATEDRDGTQLGINEITDGFTYTDASASQPYGSPPRPTLKRKASAESPDLRSSSKRASTQPLRPKSDDFGAYGYASASGSHYPYVSTPTTERSYVYSASYEHEPGTFPQHTSPRNYSYTPYTASSGQTWPSQFHSSSTDTGAAPIMPSPAELPNPTLIRTSTLQAADKGGDGNRGHGFNPYSIYPHKAVLQLNGDLVEMAKHWSADEWGCRRRLVQFWRNQKGNTIHATFRPVPQSDRPSSAVCISCIWWEERGECFVTSVDCIYLLESLIAVRFTVEEKNRIRRNLEGFRPLTVSKGKTECESFFKLIMQFPSPKPRNIEKDVKVFSWSILPHALKKIIGKYSASYSSTASIIPPTPGASPYPGAPPRPADSLPTRATPSPSHGDTIAPPAPSSAALLSASVSLPVTAGGSPVNRGTGLSDPHISLPGIGPGTGAHSLWAPPQTLPAAHPIAPPHAHRGSWDGMPYLDSGTASSSAYYPRDNGVSAAERPQSSTQTTNNLNVS